MEKYYVISDEIGYPQWNPYFETENEEEATIVCKLVSQKYDCWCVIFKNNFKFYGSGNPRKFQK